MAKRIQLSRKKGYRKPSDAVNVARPTKWGNPYNWKNYTLLNEFAAKAMAVECFDTWLNGEMVGRYYPEQKQWILDYLHKLRGKDLACWCKPDEPCHAIRTFWG